MARFLFVAFAVLVPMLPGLTAQPQNKDRYDAEQMQWVASILKDMQSIKVGMTRRELLKVFNIEGGLHTRTLGRYFYRRCSFIHVDVEFAPASDPNDWKTDDPDDKIVKITKPYLDWFIAD